MPLPASVAAVQLSEPAWLLAVARSVPPAGAVASSLIVSVSLVALPRLSLTVTVTVLIPSPAARVKLGLAAKAVKVVHAAVPLAMHIEATPLGALAGMVRVTAVRLVTAASLLITTLPVGPVVSVTAVLLLMAAKRSSRCRLRLLRL